MELDKLVKLDKVIAKVKTATENNDHTGARIILAQLTGNDFLENAYKHVQGLQDLFKYMPEDLNDLRLHELDPRLTKELQKQFPQDIDRIKSAL